MSWQGLNEIISNIQKKGGLKKKFEISMLKDFLNRNYGVENISFRGTKLEIRAETSILAQELFLKREKIKKELNKLLESNAQETKDSDFSKIKEIIIRTGK
jgi:hypothetical protein